jgi:ABC-type glycerol-3-phosphate transport system substrate-binding protein
MKKLVAVSLMLAVVLTGVFAEGKKLVVWSFTDELQKMIEYYKADNPGADIEFVLVPNDVYQSKLKPVLQSGQGAPDVFTLEAGYVKGYVGTGWMGDLSSLSAQAANTLAYTKDITTDANGKLRGLSWQATPGAYYFRASLAKKYWGTDDPVKIQAKLKDLNSFVAAAEELKKASGGKAVIISSLGDLFQVFKSGRKAPWVNSTNVFTFDPVMDRLLDVAKTFHDKGYEGRVGQWAEGWFSGMKGALTNEKGEPVEVMGYFLPTWGLHYVLKPNAGPTAGDWRMIQGPIPYFWGGTWVAAYNKSKNKEEAMKLIAYLTTNEKFLTKWAKDTGDVVSNLKVVNAIKDTYKEPFLGGQNHYAAFAELAKNVNGKVLSGFDQEIESIFQEQMNAYVNGEKDKKTAIQDFKEGVSSQFPDLKVN